MPWIKSDKEEVLKEYPNLKEFLPFLDIQNTESPRGTVLVGCSYLDQQLKSTIGAFLIKSSDKDALLNGFNAPIGTFSARIKMAFCLGLITDEERSDANTMRKIRNEFAHDHKASFEDQSIIDLCNNLHHSAKRGGDGVDDPYGLFSTASTCLILNLVNRPHYVERGRLKKREWQR